MRAAKVSVQRGRDWLYVPTQDGDRLLRGGPQELPWP